MSTLNYADPTVWAALDHGRHTGPSVGVTILCFVVAIAAVSLRIYTRHTIVQKVGFDDYMAIVSLVTFLISGIVVLALAQNGLGCHIWDIALSKEGFKPFLKLYYVDNILYNVTLLFVKLSILLQYYRIVWNIPRYCQIYLVATGLVTAWMIAQVFVMTFYCTPVSAYWDWSPGDTCLSFNMVYLNAAGNIVTDVIIILLPVPVIQSLQLKRSQKWGLFGIASIGSFTCFVSILRLVFIVRLKSDFTYDTAGIEPWSIAELASGIVCSAMFALRPLMIRCFPGMMNATVQSIPTNTYPLTPVQRQRAGSGDIESGEHASDKAFYESHESHESQTELVQQVDLKIEIGRVATTEFAAPGHSETDPNSAPTGKPASDPTETTTPRRAQFGDAACSQARETSGSWLGGVYNFVTGGGRRQSPSSGERTQSPYSSSKTGLFMFTRRIRLPFGKGLLP